jgi:DNA-binding NarL/FixJ family response regulator
MNFYHPIEHSHPRSARQSVAKEEASQSALSPREFELLQLVVCGYKNKQIASTLLLSPHTVSDHLKSIYRKLAVNSRNEATAYAFRNGLVH